MRRADDLSDGGLHQLPGNKTLLDMDTNILGAAGLHPWPPLGVAGIAPHCPSWPATRTRNLNDERTAKLRRFGSSLFIAPTLAAHLHGDPNAITCPPDPEISPLHNALKFLWFSAACSMHGASSATMQLKRQLDDVHLKPAQPARWDRCPA